MRWIDLPLRTKGFIVIAIPCGAVLFLAIAAYFVAASEREMERDTLHALEMRAEVQKLLVNLVDAETGIRGYLLTRRPEFLEPYDNASQQLQPAVDRLGHLLALPEERVHHSRVRELVARRRQILLRTLSASNGQPGTDLVTLLSDGKAAMDSLRRELAAMLAIEDRVLAERSRLRETLHRRHVGLSAICLVFGLAGGLLAGVQFTEGIVRRVHVLEDNARQMAAGQRLRSPDDVASDEIGELERTIRKTSALLVERAQTISEAAAQIEDMYEHAPCGYHSLDRDGVVVRINATELEWLGYSRAEVVGRKSYRDLLAPPSRELFDTDFEQFVGSGRISRLEVDLLRKDGDVLPVSMSASPIVDGSGRVVWSRSMVFDIADQRRAEAAVRELNEELERRLIEQHALNRELEAFSYSVSHDLRAPLRSIDGFAQALSEDYEGQLDAAGRDFLTRIRAAAQRMGHLIDDLLGLSRVTRTQLNIREVDLTAIAREVAYRLQEQAPARRVDWRIDDGLRAYADAQLVRIVFDNLLSNAWKFTAKTALPVIEVQSATLDDEPGFAVRDNGTGFELAYADKLFGAFQRLHSAAEYPGTGIGLATVQRVIHKHGGLIRAEATPGQGARFVFTFGPGSSVMPDASMASASV
jgi:PAS domain S-box-containing protein